MPSDDIAQDDSGILHHLRGFWRWRARRNRAVCLGDMGHAKLWYGPESGDTWQAKRRFAWFTVPSNNDVESAVRMLDNVHFCELYVDRDRFGEGADAQ